MKSYTTPILMFSLSVYLCILSVLTQLWWVMILGGLCWVAAMWIFYFIEKSNIAHYKILEKAYRRSKKNSDDDRLESVNEIHKLKGELESERKKKNIITGGHVHMDKLKELVKNDDSPRSKP